MGSSEEGKVVDEEKVVWASAHFTWLLFMAIVVPS